MSKLDNIFKVECPVIGVIHLPALPGTPLNSLRPEKIISRALNESNIYANAGVDGLIIENMHDVPYIKNDVGPEISTLMAVVGYEIKKRHTMPCGIQILSSANKAAVATAYSAGLDFIRAEGFVYGHVADEGYIDASAGELLRYRKMIGADNIAILTDVKKKHSAHAITSDVSIAETSKTSEFFLSEGIIVSGSHTGMAIEAQDLTDIRGATSLPIIAGSGVTVENVDLYLSLCDALIIGSYFKKQGHWAEDLDPSRIDKLIKKVASLRQQ